VSAAPPLVLMLSAAHPPDDLRVVGKEGAALAAAGWRVRHLCPGDPATAPRQHAGVAIEVYPRAAGWWGRLRNVPALARRAAASGAAVIHASEPDAWLAAIIAAGRRNRQAPSPALPRCAGEGVIPLPCAAGEGRGGGASPAGHRPRVVLDVHEHYPSRLDARLPAPLRPLARAVMRFACRWMARRADLVVVAKDGLAADFCAPERILPVRNYAQPVQVTPRVHAPGPVTLVHLGAIGRSRGWPALLDALALAPVATRLLVVGRFTDGSEAEFRARAAALDLLPRVEIQGWVPHAEALRRAARCDIGVILFQPGERNHQLALPHKLFDAMLAGLPVIAPRFATEVAGIVRDAGCGELVDPADPADVAAAVARLSDPLRRAALGAAGRHAALTRYSWDAEAARLVQAYARLAPLSESGCCPRSAGAGSPG